MEGVKPMNIKHISYSDKKIFVLYYRAINTLYYNINFKSGTILIIIK